MPKAKPHTPKPSLPTPVAPRTKEQVEQDHSIVCQRLGNARLSYLGVEQDCLRLYASLTQEYAQLVPGEGSTSKSPTDPLPGAANPTLESGVATGETDSPSVGGGSQ